MKLITDHVDNSENGVPATGEWVLSSVPGQFTVCLNNDTGLLPQYDRLAVHVQFLTQKEEADADGARETEFAVTLLFTMNGARAGDVLPRTDESRAFINAVADRIGKAVDDYNFGTTEEQKQKMWYVARQVIERTRSPLDKLVDFFGLRELARK